MSLIQKQTVELVNSHSINRCCERFSGNPVMEFPDVYDWVCRVGEWGGVESLKQIVLVDNPFSLELCARYNKRQLSIRFRLFGIGSTQHGLIVDLGTCDIQNCREESVHHNLLPLSSLLFWGLFSPLSPDSEEHKISGFLRLFSGVLRFSFLRSLLSIEGGTIEPTEYKQLFNSLISATCSSFPSYSEEFGLHKDGSNVSPYSSCFKIVAQAQQKAVLLLGPAGTHRFMHLWASQFTAESLSCCKECPSMLRISYNSNIGGFLKITSYSPLLSMETSSESPITEGLLHRALSYHQIQCIFQFRHVVNFCPHWIEVCLQMDNVRCDVCPLDPTYLKDMNIIGDFPNERHFPAKICLTIGPENGCDVHSVSLTLSSHNPITEIAKGNAYEVTFEPPKNVGFKASATTTSTVKIKDWGFEQSVVNYSDAKIDWTLYDSTTGKAVFKNGPPKFSVLGPKTWSIDRYSKACRAFTEEGGVVFTKDVYGKPITWRLNRKLEGQTLKWVVKGSIWLTYWPNTHRTRCSETKRHDFHQEVDLTLLQSS